MEFGILGPLEVRRDGGTVRLVGEKRRALLALLLLRPNEAVPFDALIEDLWGAGAPPSARAALQNLASALRRLLGADRLLTDGTAYRLRVEANELDLDRFEGVVTRAQEAEPQLRAELLSQALSMWRGTPLVEFSTAPFAQAEARRLEEKHLAVVEQRIEAELDLGRADELVGELERLLARHPLRERLWGLLMLALYESARQAEALSTYRRAHRALVDELGIEPGRELKELQRRILLQEPIGGGRSADPLLHAASLLPTGKRQRALSLLDYAQALRRIGENATAMGALEEATRLAERLGDPVVAARARLLRSSVELFDRGASLRDHLEQAGRAAAVFEDAGDHAALADALRLKGQLLRDLGEVDRATLALEGSLTAAILGGARWQEAMSRGFLATCLAWGPTPVEAALAACEEHLEALEWEPPGPVGVRVSIGELLGQAGRVEEGREHIVRSAEGCRRMGVPGTLVFCLQALARLDVMAGDPDAAENPLREASGLLAATGNRGARCVVDAELAYVLAPTDSGEADALVRGSRRLAADDDFTAQVAWRRARARLEPGEDAVGRLEDAVALCAASEFVNLHASTLEDLAARSDGARRAEALTEALALYEGKGNVLGAARVREMLA